VHRAFRLRECQRKKRFVWPDQLHLDFVAAIFDLARIPLGDRACPYRLIVRQGLKYASADGLFEELEGCEQLISLCVNDGSAALSHERLFSIHRDDLHEHMQAYRDRRTQHKKPVRRAEDSSARSAAYVPGSNMEHLSSLHREMYQRFIDTCTKVG
jgi:hypothetical protein